MDQKNLSLQDTTDIFTRFQQGDGDAFRVLYDRYFSRLYLVVNEFVPQQLAEDIVSNAFIKLYNRRQAIKELEHIYPFLFVCARNEMIDHHRQQKRQRAARETHEMLVDTEYHDPRESEFERDRWMARI